MAQKLNQTERDLIENKFEESYNFIRSQNSIKKDQRDLKGIEKAKKVVILPKDG